MARGALCFVPVAKWRPRDAVLDWAETHDWDIYRIKSDHGCYELTGHDERGLKFEVLVNPKTLKVIRFEYDNENEDWRRKESDGND